MSAIFLLRQLKSILYAQRDFKWRSQCIQIDFYLYIQIDFNLSACMHFRDEIEMKRGYLYICRQHIFLDTLTSKFEMQCLSIALFLPFYFSLLVITDIAHKKKKSKV